MVKILLKTMFALIIGISLTLGQALAAEFTVTVKNLTNGIYFTPLLITAHDSTTRLFETGTAASIALQAMAEGGDISDLEASVGGADDDTVVDPAAGTLGPGSSTTANLNTDITGNSVLSIAAMILPTNDGFVGLDSLAIPQTPGTYTLNLNAYDAGTEANDELLVVNGGGVPGTAGIPGDPGGNAGTGGSGVTTTEDNTMVHIHRGSLGDTDAVGGISDLDSTVHRWLNPVAQLVIEVQ